MNTALFLVEEGHKKLIEGIKKFRFFSNLSEEDRISLIKGDEL